MEAKWPLMLISFCLVFALGLTIAGLERTSVMNNWTSRRCELPVMATSMFFKPDSDPRTKGQFAKENFDFCMKSYVDKFMNLLLAPVMAIFGKQNNVAGSALDMVNTIRTIAQTLYNTLSTYLEQYYKRFSASVYEMSRIAQYLRMAIRRANAVAISMLYSGITLFRGMLNTIQFIIKVILIICGIMLAIIIILIFILFPVIPIITATLGAIIATVLALSMIVSGTIANEASSDQSGFCFAEDTKITVKLSNNTTKQINVKDITLGMELVDNCGEVTSTIKMDGTNENLYKLNGIYVSGSHLIKGTDNIWKSVSSDERAVKTNTKSQILYCFNTSTHTIPVYSPELNTSILFRDWEELADNDIISQYGWTHMILDMLNNQRYYHKWKNSVYRYKETPILSRNIKVKTTDGFISINNIKLFSNNVLDISGNPQKVLGTIDLELEGKGNTDNWHTSLYEKVGEIWQKGKSTVCDGTMRLIGKMLIVETGQFIIWDEDEHREKIIRDFTEIGYKEIHKTYPFVAYRLRTTK